MEGCVFSLKGKKKAQELPPLWSDDELEQMAVNYNSVLEWLLGLSDKDYETVCKVTDIHRQASKDEAKVRGVEFQPTSFIDPPEPTHVTDPATAPHIANNMLEDDDELSLAFLEDDHDTPASKSQRKTAKKVTRAKVKDGN